MNAWTLPTSLAVCGTNYRINADFRDVLEVIHYLTDESLPEFIRWRVATELFYEDPVRDIDFPEAMKQMADFISYGTKDTKPGPKLIDWDIDAQMIVADVNKVSGKEVRAVPFLHWWTFLSYFYGIGEGQLSTVVSIRHKKAKGKKLEKWEQEYYQENKTVVDMKKPDTEEIQKEKENILRFL
jgi:hypothetical protein